jgi:putative ABC transport system permease protein
MFRNYLKITLRNLAKHKGFSFINILGLSLGLTCVIMIALWIQDEMSYDAFHQNADRLFRVLDTEKYDSGEITRFAMNPADLAPTLENEYPEIISAVRLRGIRNATIAHDEKQFNEHGIVFVDPEFFALFSYPFVHGAADVALPSPYSIVINERIAKKYFGDQNPMGQTMRIDNKVDVYVTGVIQNLPANSHLDFECALAFDRAQDFGFQTIGWASFAHTTYVLLDEHADFSKVNTKIADVVKRNDSEAIVTLSLQSVPDIHLHSQGIWGVGGDGDIKYIYIFMIIAVFVLLIACINFMNLSTARSSKRAKEIGLRKVIGAGRKNIIRQFYGESLLFAFISLLFSLFLVQLSLPLFNKISGKHLDFSMFSNTTILFLLFGIVLVTGVFAGTYPALFLSSFKPVKVLKGSIKSGAKNASIRRILVSTQFVLTIILIIGTMVVDRQLNFIQNQNLGYDKEHIICVDIPGEFQDQIDAIKNCLSSNPNVLNVSAVSNIPTNITLSTILSDWQGQEGNEKLLVHMLSSDYDFAKTMNIEMVQGRFYSREFIADTSNGLLINEAAQKKMALESPIGKTILGSQIIGVIKDFHFRSLHSSIAPLILFFDPSALKHLLVRIQTADLENTIETLDSSWRTIVPSMPFEYSFLDEQLDKLYAAEKQSKAVINLFTFLAFFIAGLGLFGLATFTVEQRTKEIGIRKALGASIIGIFFLLSSEFLKWLVIANIIAWPIAWIAMNKWLQNFAYRTEMTIWPFLLSGIAALTIALFTVSWQAVRAATANPVEALRYE